MTEIARVSEIRRYSKRDVRKRRLYSLNSAKSTTIIRPATGQLNATTLEGPPGFESI